MKKLLIAVFCAIALCAVAQNATPSSDKTPIEKEAYSLVDEMIAMTIDSKTECATPKTIYKSKDDSTLVIGFDVVVSREYGDKRIEPFEILYQVNSKSETWSAINQVNKNGSVMYLAEELYKDKVASETGDTLALKDEIYWFTVTAQLHSLGYKLK